MSEMRLRKLCLKDVPFMLEWMHEKKVTNGLKKNFADKTTVDCETFIKGSWADERNVHFAVTNENDEYMGTVSLKNIDKISGEAEFAIVIRLKAMGCGFASYAMREILKIGLEKLNLIRIYWCVLKDNKRAIRFYDKSGYHRLEKKNSNTWGEDIEMDKEYFWYMLEKKM